MIVPTYLTLPEAVQFLSDKTAQPVTTNWLLRLASEEKLQMFFHPQQYIVTGNPDDPDSLKYYAPGTKYPLDKGWATVMSAHQSINLQVLPDANGKPTFINDLNFDKRTKIPLVINEVYVLASEISLLADFPDHKRPDYQKWKRSELWTIAEAAYLLSDIEPISLDTPFHLKNMSERTSEIYQNIKHALEKGKIFQQGRNRSGLVAGKKILPSDAVVWFVNWCANSNTFSLPDELWDLHPSKSRVKPEFKPNESLITAVQAHLESPYSSLPEYLRKHIDAAFSSSNEWDSLTKNRRLSILDCYDLQYNPLREVENSAGWWDATMDATMDATYWWNLPSVEPLQAAMLLVRLNPNETTEESARITTTDETSPQDFIKLQNAFTSLERANSQPRKLSDWLQCAKELKIKRHSWLEKWKSFHESVMLPKHEVVGNEFKTIARDTQIKTTAHRIKTRDSILDAEIAEAKKLAVDPNNTRSIWAELQKLAETKTGALFGFVQEGIQYKGKQYTETGVPDIFSFDALKSRIARERKQSKNL